MNIIEQFNKHLEFNDNLAAISFYHSQNLIQKQAFNDYYLKGADHIVVPVVLQLTRGNYDDFYDFVDTLLSKHCAESNEFTMRGVEYRIVDWLYYNNNSEMDRLLSRLILVYSCGEDYNSRLWRAMCCIIKYIYTTNKLNPAECKPFKGWQKIEKFLQQYADFGQLADMANLDEDLSESNYNILCTIKCDNIPFTRWINNLTLIKGMTNMKPREYDMVITTNFYDMLTCSEGVDWSSCLKYNGCNNINTLAIAGMSSVAMVGLVECGTYKQGTSKWKRRSFVQAEPNKQGSFVIAESYPNWDSSFITQIKEWFKEYIDINEHDENNYSTNSFIGMLGHIGSEEVYFNNVQYIQPFYYVETQPDCDVILLKEVREGRIEDYETY